MINIFIAITIGLAFSAIYWTGSMRDYENIISDYMIKKLTNPEEASSKIVFAMTSQRCLNEAKIYYNIGWPWKRAAYAKIIRFLKLSGAKLIVFDSIFSEKSVFQDIDNDDKEFAKAVKQAGNVIIGYQFRLPKNMRKRSDDDKQSNPMLERFSVDLKNKNNKNPFKKSNKAHLPIKSLTESALSIGAVNSYIDDGGIYRRNYLLINYFGKTYPSLSLATILSYYKTNKINIRDNSLYIKARKVPLDQEGFLRIKYYGTNELYKDYYHIDMLRVYDHINRLYAYYSKLENIPNITYESLFHNHKQIKRMRALIKSTNPELVNEIGDKLIEKIPPESFRDKIVLIGSIAPGLSHTTPTLFKSGEASIHLHASVINNFLNNDFLYEFRENRYLILIIVLASLLTGYLTNRLHILWSSILSLTLIISFFGLSITLFSIGGIIIDVLTPIIAILFTFFTFTIINHFKTYKLAINYANTIETRNKEITRLNTKIHNSLKNKLNAIKEQLTLFKLSLSENIDYDKDKLAIISKLTAHCSSETRNILFSTQYQDCTIKRLIDELTMRAELSFPTVNIYYSIISKDFPETLIIKSAVTNYLLDMYTELSNNIIKHSGATKVSIEIDYFAGKITLTMTDDGIGFDYDRCLEEQKEQSDSYGLAIIDRLTEDIGSDLSFTSDAKYGTTVKIIIDNIL